MARYRKKENVSVVVEAVQFVPTAQKPGDIENWGYVQGLYNKMPIYPDCWILSYGDGRVDVLNNSVFRQVYELCPSPLLQREMMQENSRLLDSIQDLQARVKKLEEENQRLHQDADQKLISYDYEHIYEQVLERMNRDLRMSTRARTIV